MLTDIVRFNPTDDLRQMQRFMDRFWGNYPRTAREDVELTTFEEAALPVDVFEANGNLVVKAALPGVEAKDIDINVTDGVLSIRAETRTEKDVTEGNWHRQEYRYGKYARSFRMPPDVDASKAMAKFENGMLRLTFPKSEPTKDKSIHVKVG